ncbi:hypothetical protein [Fulvivirga lutimaris]|uniref:hypothetical protein n=1 Tax=Fulvivirga lutimaris TaxID=1819566 RepID=UPI0012BB5D2F|nr:hypothetical protein [Fulvivirga lutimaris]MTI41779.1 hypothetical protein [Fulvivirga lutimaris]
MKIKSKALFSVILLLIGFKFSIAQNLIHLATDQPFYFAGQEMEFSFLLVDAFTKVKSEGDEVVYIVLKNNAQGNIIENKVFARSGKGELSVQIPANTKSGFYELIAWTNHLKNFGPESYFRKKIAVYTPDYDGGLNPTKSEPSFTFAAEGGHLVDNIASRVAYQHIEKCANLSAILMEDEDKEILSIELSSQGIGSIIFKPKTGHTYQLKHACSGKPESFFSLPQVETEGYAFSAIQRSQKTQLIVRSSNKSHKNDSLKIIGYQQNYKVFEVKGKIKKDYFLVEINNQELPEGVVNFILLNESGEIEGNRMVFNTVGSADSLDINLNADNLSTRQTVKIEIGNNKENALLSAYVLSQESYDHFNKLSDGLLTFSNRYFDSNPLNINQTRDLESRMIIESEKYKEIPDTFIPTRYFPKEKYFLMRGNLVDDKPLPDTTTAFFFVPEINTIYQLKIDRLGFFEEAILFEYYGKQEIPFYLMAGDHQFKNPRIISRDFEVLSKYNLAQELPWTDHHKTAQAEFNARQQIESVYNHYSSSKEDENNDASTFDISQMLPAPDATFNLNEYVAFSTMEETIKEIIAGLSVRKKKGEVIVRIFEENWLKFYGLEKTYAFESTPLILINGRPSSADQLLALNPVDVEEIKIISDYEKLMKHLPFGVGGIVLVKMKENAELPDINNFDFFNTTGVTEPIEKKNSIPVSNVPDMRSTLLWQPYQKVSETTTLEFTTSDRPGEYVILVEQIDENGKISYASKSFTVSFNGLVKNDKPD